MTQRFRPNVNKQSHSVDVKTALTRNVIKTSLVNSACIRAYNNATINSGRISLRIILHLHRVDCSMPSLYG